MEYLDEDNDALFKIDEDDKRSGIHSLPNCSVWDHTEGLIYYICLEVHSKDNYNNVNFCDVNGAKIRTSELEELARDRLPNEYKDMKLKDMEFRLYDDCAFVKVEFWKSRG